MIELNNVSLKQIGDLTLVIPERIKGKGNTLADLELLVRDHEGKVARYVRVIQGNRVSEGILRWHEYGFQFIRDN